MRGLYEEVSRKEKDPFLFAQAIAFKVLVSIVPVVILATGVLGQVLRRDRPFEIVAAFVQDLLPPYQSQQLLEFLQTLQAASGTITIVGVVGLLISAVTLMTTLRIVLSLIFNEDWHKTRSILRGYLFDLRMVGQVGLLFLLTFGLTVAMQWIGVVGADFFRWIGLDYMWLREGWLGVFKVIGFVVPFILSVAMFAQMYFFVPSPHPPKRSALRGAIVTALLFEAAKYGFTFYAANVAHFDLGNTFGLVLAFVFWVYFSGLVFCFGAFVVLLDEKRMKIRRGEIPRPERRKPTHPKESATPARHSAPSPTP